MTSGDGTLYTNRFDYLEIVPGRRLVLDHGSDIHDDPARFPISEWPERHDTPATCVASFEGYVRSVVT